jgi:outer membrane protein assembly factor BamB
MLSLSMSACGSGGETGSTVPSSDDPESASLPPTLASPLPVEDALVTALNTDGTVRWQVPKTPEMDMVDGGAWVVGDMVTARSECENGRPLMTGVWDLQTGAQLALGPPTSVEIPMVTSGDIGVVSSATGEVRAVDVATGEELWSVADAWLSTAPIGDAVLVGTNQGIEARALDTGEVVWTKPDPSASTVAWDDERLYFSTYDESGQMEMAAVDVADGSTVWTTPSFDQALAVVEGIVVSNAVTGQAMEARDARTGEVVWTMPNASLPFSYWGSMTGDGNLYAFVPEGLAALDARTGKIRWSLAQAELPDLAELVAAIPGGLLARQYDRQSPAPADAEIVALAAADGSVLWRHTVPFPTDVRIGADVVLLSAPCS